MAVVSLDPEKLRAQAAVYSAASRDVESAVQNVNRANGEIAEQWRGAAFEAYLRQYDELYAGVQKFEALLESINAQLVSYADEMERRDAEDSRAFGLS